MYNNLIILAAGASSRMKSSLASSNLSATEIRQANSQSKALISLGGDNRPLLDYLLINAEKAGYKNVFLVVGENSKSFKKCYGSKEKGNQYNGLNVSYAVQYIPKGREKPFGTADALFQAMEHFPELQKSTFTVCNSDNLYSLEALAALRNNLNSSAFIAYDRDGLEFSMDRIASFAIVSLDSENYLIDIIEKPSVETVEKFRDSKGKIRVSMNIFKLKGQDIYSFLKNCPIHPERSEKELPTAVLNMCKDNPKTLKGIPFKEQVPDLTSKADIAILKNYIVKHFKA